MDARLEEFARAVLEMMEATEEWSSDLLDEIIEKANELGLAGLNADGMFMSLVPEVTCDCKRANGPRAVCHCDGKGGWS